MPKMKTKSAAKKRFGVTGTGKIKRAYAKKRHLLASRPQKMKRKARGTVVLDRTNEAIVLRFMPYL